jgi:hypothetical protein
VCEAELRKLLDQQLANVASSARALPRTDFVALGGLELAMRLALGDDVSSTTGPQLLAQARQLCALPFAAQTDVAEPDTPSYAVAGNYYCCCFVC